MKTLILLLLVITTASTFAQQSQSTYYIDVLIDANKDIYFDDTKVSLDAVPKITRSKVDNLKFVEGKGITYRIFADTTLKLGDIMDIQNFMYKGFSQPGLSTRRYLLKTSEIPVDKNNWIEQLNKLDLKAIEN